MGIIGAGIAGAGAGLAGAGAAGAGAPGAGAPGAGAPGAGTTGAGDGALGTPVPAVPAGRGVLTGCDVPLPGVPVAVDELPKPGPESPPPVDPAAANPTVGCESRVESGESEEQAASIKAHAAGRWARKTNRDVPSVIMDVPCFRGVVH